MNEALFRRNAEACENAKYPTCVCACGGKFHGKAHSETWIINRVASERPPVPKEPRDMPQVELSL